MREQEPMTQTMKISDVKNKLSRLVNEVYRQETRVLVEKAGIPVAALVSARDLKQLAEFDAQRAAGSWRRCGSHSATCRPPRSRRRRRRR